MLIANSTPTPDTITFATSLTDQTIMLEHGEIVIDNDYVISGTGSSVFLEGLGADRLTVSGRDQSRIFRVTDGSSAFVEDITLTRGYSDSSGGAILTAGNVLSLARVAIRDSNAYYAGGAIRQELTGSGGGQLAIMDSELSGNTARYGGAIESAASVTIVNSTFSGNAVTIEGGALHLGGRVTTLRQSTITNNRADLDGDGGQSGGIWIGPDSLVASYNTIVSGNTVGRVSADEADDVSGNLTSASRHNFIGVDRGLTGITDGTAGNQIGTIANPLDPKLGPLQFNGGPTQTHALASGSPAIDAGDSGWALDSNSNPLTTDQRGQDRIVDGNKDGDAHVDVGAVEFLFRQRQFLPGDSDRNGAVDFADFLTMASRFGRRGDATWEHGDCDGDGNVDFTDFLLLATNFGR